MADYARRDALRDQRRRAESNRRLRTRRPIRGNVPSPTWTMEGPITLERFFPPALVTNDPVGDGDYPEYKRIVGVDAWLSSGAVTIDWLHNAGYLFELHEITATPGANRVMFDGLSGRPEPFVINNGLLGGEFLRPVLREEPATASENISCILLMEAVAV